jgi:hypothetical protein
MSDPEIVWNKEQKQAISDIADWANAKGNTCISLSGAAGCGKTTILKEAKKSFETKPNVSWTAMTGRAALRLNQAAGVPATTLHSQLYTRPKIGARGALMFETINMEKRPDILVVDESSMISPKIYEDLKKWEALGTRILLVGDYFQLPPVMSPDEEKQYGADFSVFSLAKGPVLRQVMRSDSDTITVATQLREQGKLLMKNHGSYTFKVASLPDKMAVEDYISDQDDHCLITWRNNLRMSSNADIRNKLGHVGMMPLPGEPVIVKRNGQTVLNGETHKVKTLTPGPRLGELSTFWLTTESGKKILTSVQGRNQKVDGLAPFLKDWHAYRDGLRKGSFEEPIPITYGYVHTAHSKQGDEARRVTVFLSYSDTQNEHFRKPTILPDGSKAPFATRFMYTSLTRARKQVTVILGQ